MTKCPNCAQENMNESLFCKHCGRCLLEPDPEVVQRLIAMPTEHDETPEAIAFSDGYLVEQPRAARLMVGRHQTAPGVIQGRLLVLNLLVLIFMFEMVRHIITR
jgi:hypothetical protein